MVSTGAAGDRLLGVAVNIIALVVGFVINRARRKSPVRPSPVWMRALCREGGYARPDLPR